MTNAVEKATENVGMFYAILDSISKFNEIEIKCVLANLISPTERDNCFLGTTTGQRAMLALCWN